MLPEISVNSKRPGLIGHFRGARSIKLAKSLKDLTYVSKRGAVEKARLPEQPGSEWHGPRCQRRNLALEGAVRRALSEMYASFLKNVT